MHEVMADCFLATDDLDECERHVRANIRETEMGIEHGGPTYAIQSFAVAKAYFLLGNAMLRKNDLPGASDAFSQSAATLEPILDLYNTREIHKSTKYIADLFGAYAWQENTADQADVDALTRAMSAWRTLSEGNDSVFAAEEQRIFGDIQSASRAELKSLLNGLLAACYGLRYGNLLKTADADDAGVQAAESRCIEFLLSWPDRDPLQHMRYPEYQELRSSPGFMQAFRTQ